MADEVIRVNNLGKAYWIEHQKRESYTTLRDVVTTKAKNFFKRKRTSTIREQFWALNNVNFTVNRGDRIGIIGRNGAGKSTLLKILSRITEPSCGRIEIEGRVASLLEVGTGFHPELTGRENIFLNGAILGMSRKEIADKFDAIVDFAEVEQFLDTPVKRYSSGMYVRLAFAIAAHLEPEILIVDEVLAVGDMRFQEKCLGKMEEISSTGERTVLFVSHNIDAIRKLCTKGLLLNKGQVAAHGDMENVLQQYMVTQDLNRANGNVILLRETIDEREYSVQRIEVLDSKGQPKNEIQSWDTVTFRIHYYSPQYLASGSVVVNICTQTGSSLLLFSTQPDNKIHMDFAKGYSYIDCTLPKLQLSAGKYLITAYLALPGIGHISGKLDWASIEILPNDIFKSGLPPNSNRYLIPHDHSWKIT